MKTDENDLEQKSLVKRLPRQRNGEIFTQRSSFEIHRTHKQTDFLMKMKFYSIKKGNKLSLILSMSDIFAVTSVKNEGGIFKYFVAKKLKTVYSLAQK